MKGQIKTMSAIDKDMVGGYLVVGFFFGVLLTTGVIGGISKSKILESGPEIERRQEFDWNDYRTIYWLDEKTKEQFLKQFSEIQDVKVFRDVPKQQKQYVTYQEDKWGDSNIVFHFHEGDQSK